MGRHKLPTGFLREELDRWFPDRGPCAFCGHEETANSLGARHRLIDAIAENVLAGDRMIDVADAHEMPVEAVECAVNWVVHERAMNRRPPRKVTTI